MTKLPYLVIAMLSLTACSGEPWTVSQSPNEITLRWWNSDNIADAQANGDAGAYCTRLGKAVQLGDMEHDGSAVIAHYRCD
jgi:hypothetical protein